MFERLREFLSKFVLKSELQALFRVIKYIGVFMAFYFMATPVHEWAHLMMLVFLGGQGHITRRGSLIGPINVMEYTVPPTSPTPEIGMFLVSLAGGVAVALLYFALVIVDWQDGDVIGSMAILPLACGQLFYGIAEGLSWNLSIYEFTDIGAIATVIGLLVGFVPSLIIAVKYIVKDLWSEVQ